MKNKIQRHQGLIDLGVRLLFLPFLLLLSLLFLSLLSFQHLFLKLLPHNFSAHHRANLTLMLVKLWFLRDMIGYTSLQMCIQVIATWAWCVSGGVRQLSHQALSSELIPLLRSVCVLHKVCSYVVLCPKCEADDILGIVETIWTDVFLLVRPTHCIFKFHGMFFGTIYFKCPSGRQPINNIWKGVPSDCVFCFSVIAMAAKNSEINVFALRLYTPD